MNKSFEKYGVTAVDRPKIKAIKRLDLSGKSGQQIVRFKTEIALRAHSKTFKKLADM